MNIFVYIGTDLNLVLNNIHVNVHEINKVYYSNLGTYYVYFVTGKGNTSPASEFNFRCDPESAYVVLKELECPKLIVSWEVCLDNGLPWVCQIKRFTFKNQLNTFCEILL